MLAEAGGRITALDGGPFDLRNGQLMASNGAIHDALLEVVLRWRERRAIRPPA
jgi:myo-inositol-1(or 4)-monophosphatase